MSKPGPGRVRADRPLDNRARITASRLARAEQRAADYATSAEEARTELSALLEAAVEKFGRPIPPDALLLDLLDLIDVEEGDVWRWRGMRNNYGIPTLRVAGAEKSLPRFLGIAFGVISEDAFGSLYPANGDAEDVNPWHRVLRESPRPLGNRFRFAPVEAKQ